MHPKDWHFSWNNLAIGFFLRCNKFRRQSGIWRKKIFGSVITQLTEPLFDSDHDLGEMVEENSVPIQRQNLVRYCTHPKRQKSIDFLYHFNLFIFFVYFVQNLFFLMVCKRRSYFAMVPVKEVDSTSPPPLPPSAPSILYKNVEVFIHSLVMDFTHVCILNTRKHIQVCFHIRW